MKAYSKYIQLAHVSNNRDNKQIKSALRWQKYNLGILAYSTKNSDDRRMLNDDRESVARVKKRELQVRSKLQDCSRHIVRVCASFHEIVEWLERLISGFVDRVNLFLELGKLARP